MSQVGIYPDKWGESKRVGPSMVPVVRQNAPDSSFHPFRRNPSLHVPFKKFAKDNKPLYDFALSSMGWSLAAAHSSLHAAALIKEFLQRLPTVLEGPYWAKWCVNVAQALKIVVLLPFCDSAGCLSGSVGSSVTAIRTGVVKSAEVAIQPVLRTSPPSAGFFFGDPVAQVSTLLNFAMMSTLIKEKRPAAKLFVKRPAAAAPCAAGAPASPASTSKDARGKGYGRNSRGRGGGWK